MLAGSSMRTQPVVELTVPKQSCVPVGAVICRWPGLAVSEYVPLLPAPLAKLHPLPSVVELNSSLAAVSAAGDSAVSEGSPSAHATSCASMSVHTETGPRKLCTQPRVVLRPSWLLEVSRRSFR